MVVCRISMLLDTQNACPSLLKRTHFDIENAVFCALMPTAVDNAFAVTVVSFRCQLPRHE